MSYLTPSNAIFQKEISEKNVMFCWQVLRNKRFGMEDYYESNI